MPLLPLWAFVACSGVTFTFTFQFFIESRGNGVIDSRPDHLSVPFRIPRPICVKLSAGETCAFFLSICEIT